MGCWHGSHGCGPWYGGPHSRGCDDPGDWYEEADWPIRRGYQRFGRLDRETAPVVLEARLDELRDEVRWVGAELMKLRDAEEAAAGKT